MTWFGPLSMISLALQPSSIKVSFSNSSSKSGNFHLCRVLEVTAFHHEQALPSRTDYWTKLLDPWDFPGRRLEQSVVFSLKHHLWHGTLLLAQHVYHYINLGLATSRFVFGHRTLTFTV